MKLNGFMRQIDEWLVLEEVLRYEIHSLKIVNLWHSQQRQIDGPVFFLLYHATESKWNLSVVAIFVYVFYIVAILLSKL